jgi:hypothetical protein
LIDLDGTERVRGLGILDRSCNGGRLDACLELATKTDDREQKEAALRRALPLQEAQCNAGNATGCLWAASAYHTRDPTDPSRLIETRSPIPAAPRRREVDASQQRSED